MVVYLILFGIIVALLIHTVRIKKLYKNQSAIVGTLEKIVGVDVPTK